MSTVLTETFPPKYVPAGAGLVVDLQDHRARGKVSADDTGGAFLLGETTADPGAGVPPHIHTREDETFYVLEGRLEVLVGGRVIEAGPEDTVFAPRDVPHAWRCVSEAPARFLLFVTPGANFEAFALEMARRQYEPAAMMANPELMAEFMELATSHGIDMLPPVK